MFYNVGKNHYAAYSLYKYGSFITSMNEVLFSFQFSKPPKMEKSISQWNVFFQLFCRLLLLSALKSAELVVLHLTYIFYAAFNRGLPTGSVKKLRGTH